MTAGAPGDERLVATQPDLEAAVQRARRAGRVGLDTEFLRERTYRARLCLVQIATDDEIHLIDPLASVDLTEVAALVADDDVDVVVHAGRQDFEIFYERYGCIPRRVFDVQVAAGFVGYSASLSYGQVVETFARESIGKSESYTDWCRRPLTPAQIRYAGDDVRFLLPIAETLEERLRELGRGTWMDNEMELVTREAAYVADPGEAWRRVPGRGSLSGRQTAILKELACWRERAAMERDVPRGWVVKDATLIQIARRAPRSVDELAQVRGMAEREARRSGKEILAAIRTGTEGPPMQAPAAPRREVVARVRALVGLADALLRARCEGARIATELVTNRADVEAVLVALFTTGAAPENVRLMQGWRRELAGDAIVELAEGRIALRASSRPPYIEEARR